MAGNSEGFDCVEDYKGMVMVVEMVIGSRRRLGVEDRVYYLYHWVDSTVQAFQRTNGGMPRKGFLEILVELAESYRTDSPGYCLLDARLQKQTAQVMRHHLYQARQIIQRLKPR